MNVFEISAVKKKHLLLAVVFVLEVVSFFGEWIDAGKISFVAYSYFLMALYLARCYLFCVLTVGLIELCRKQVGMFFEATVFLPVVAGGIFILVGVPFNSMMLYSRVVTVFQVAVVTLLFGRAMFLFLERQKITVKNISTRTSQPDFSKLSPREKEVAELLLKGKTNDEIAAELFISSTTVKSHVQHIFEKYEARNRMEFANRVATSLF